MSLNAQEWPYIVIGCLAGAVQGIVMPVFAIIFSSILGVSMDDIFIKLYSEWPHLITAIISFDLVMQFLIISIGIFCSCHAIPLL